MPSPYDGIQTNVDVPRWLRDGLEDEKDRRRKLGSPTSLTALINEALVKTYKLTPPKEAKAAA